MEATFIEVSTGASMKASMEATFMEDESFRGSYFHGSLDGILDVSFRKLPSKLP